MITYVTNFRYAVLGNKLFSQSDQWSIITFISLIIIIQLWELSHLTMWMFIGHVNEYPTMHYFGIPRHTQSIIACEILTEYFWKLQWTNALWECCQRALSTQLINVSLTLWHVSEATRRTALSDNTHPHFHKHTNLQQTNIYEQFFGPTRNYQWKRFAKSLGVILTRTTMKQLLTL